MEIEERNKLIEENLKIVPWVVNRYFSTREDKNDLIAQGNLLLVRIAELYDPNKGTFSTYAVRYLAWGLYRYITHEKLHLTGCSEDSSRLARFIHKVMRGELEANEALNLYNKVAKVKIDSTTFNFCYANYTRGIYCLNIGSDEDEYKDGIYDPPIYDNYDFLVHILVDEVVDSIKTSKKLVRGVDVTERTREVYRSYLHSKVEGSSTKWIEERYGISRQRVKQIVDKYNGFVRAQNLI